MGNQTPLTLLNDGRRVYLTLAQLSVLNHLANGLVPKEIANVRSGSVETVNRHISNIYDILGVFSCINALNLMPDLTVYTAFPKQNKILTPRQIKALNLRGQGLNKKQIAEEMKCALNTANNTIANAYERLGIYNNPVLALRRAAEFGLIQSGPYVDPARRKLPMEMVIGG